MQAYVADALDFATLAAATFAKAVVIGGYDPAAHPAVAPFATSGHLRALQAERRVGCYGG